MSETQKLVDVILEEAGNVRLSPRVEHERRVAVVDLLEDNTFDPVDGTTGPFILDLELRDKRLVFKVRDAEGAPLFEVPVSLAPFKTLIRDYFMVCDSYYKAIKEASPSKIESIDMGRRGLHNEGAQLLRDKLAERVRVDEDTARRLFTLICVLHIRPGGAHA